MTKRKRKVARTPLPPPQRIPDTPENVAGILMRTPPKRKKANPHQH